MTMRPLPIGFHATPMDPKTAREIFKRRQPAGFVDQLPDAAAMAYALLPYTVVFLPRNAPQATQQEQMQARQWVQSWAAVGCIGAALTQPAVDGYTAAIVATLQPMHNVSQTVARRGLHQVGVRALPTPIALFIQAHDSVAIWLGPPPWRVVPQGIAPPIWNSERSAEMWYRRALAATLSQHCKRDNCVGSASK